jgi:transposase-like protein
MSETKTRKVYTAGFKAKVGLEALREAQTINQIAQAHGIHPVQVSQWKKEIQEHASQLFEHKRGPKTTLGAHDPERLYSEIGRLKMEVDWLKKKSGLSLPN